MPDNAPLSLCRLNEMFKVLKTSVPQDQQGGEVYAKGRWFKLKHQALKT